jgi:hypothetical protein
MDNFLLRLHADGIGLLGGTISHFANYDYPPKVRNPAWVNVTIKYESDSIACMIFFAATLELKTIIS